MTARLYTLDPLEGFRPKTFAGHKNVVLNAYFSSNSKSVSIAQGSAIHSFNYCDPIRYIQSVVMAPCSSGEPRHPKLPLMMMTMALLTHRLLRTPRLLMFAGEFTNDITSINPTRRSFAVLSTNLRGYSSSAFHPESSGSGRCPHLQTCIH